MSARADGYGGFSVGPSLASTPLFATQHITLADGEDDWQGIYIDGQLWGQNHSLSLRRFFSDLSGSTLVRAFHVVVVKDEWLSENGGLPPYLSQLPDEARA